MKYGYYGAAEPPVRWRWSHGSGYIEPAALCRERLFTWVAHDRLIALANGLKRLFAALPGNHERQRLMSRAPWNKLLADGSRPRKGGSLSPDRWLNRPRNIHEIHTFLKPSTGPHKTYWYNRNRITIILFDTFNTSVIFKHMKTIHKERLISCLNLRFLWRICAVP